MLDRLIYYSLLGYAATSCIWFSGTRSFLFLALVGAVIKMIRDKQIPRFTEPALFKAIIIFLSVMFLSALLSTNVIVGLHRAWDHTQFMLPLFLVVLFIRDEKPLKKFLWVMLVSLAATDCMAIWQGLHGNYRAPAFTSHYMIFAGYLAQLCCVILVFMTNSSKSFQKYRGAIWGLFGLTLAALFFNGTRGVWLSVAFIAVIFSFIRTSNKKKWGAGFLTVAVLLGITFMAFPHFHDRLLTITDKSFESNTERVLLWHSAWQMFLDHPFLGIGVGNFPIEYPAHYISPVAVEPHLGHAHNDFLHMLAETGAIGFLSFLYLFYTIVYRTYKNYRSHQSVYSLILLLVTAGFLLQGMTEYNFGNPPVIRMYWFLTGIAFSAAAYQSRSYRGDQSEAKHS